MPNSVRDLLEGVVLDILERDYDPAGVPPAFRVRDVEVSWVGSERRLRVVIEGVTQ